ncbi:hypothetical protein C8Q73DRAFT_267743 [Cubamyces lactineus]|nr:hypothetical protein C8Q73DRAFT_267743 [Cubamyces lactineus]
MHIFLFLYALPGIMTAKLSAASLADAQLPISSDELLHSRPILISCSKSILGRNRVLERLTPELSFSENIECGLFDVPLDWAHPELGRHKISYARYLAAPDVEREGTIFVNPGYRPSADTKMPSEQMWMLSDAPRVHESTQGKYDLVVWDTRDNNGRSDLDAGSGTIECFDTEEEKYAFYMRASEELSVEPAWDDQMDFIRKQTHEDAKNWLDLQSRVVEECVRRQNTTTLGYMGTAATVRDVAAMADFFGGPGSAINFWGIESGAHVGQYLLRMLPERAGRVLLQAPQDLNTYLHQDSYKVWREDMTYAHDVIDRFIEFCIRAEDQDCSTYWADLILDDGHVFFVNLALFDTARSIFMGWQNSHEVDSNNTAMTSAFKPVEFGNITFNPADFLYSMQHLKFERELGLDDRTLGLMPLYCGDKVTDYDPEAAAERTREIAAMLEDDIHLAPLFSSSIFPPLDYLCYLWPVRALERLTLKLGDEAPKTPAIAPLVIQYSEYPFARRVPLSNVAPGIQGIREVVQEKLTGTINFRPETCVSDIIAKYLSNGEVRQMVARSGEVQFGAEVKDTTHVPAPEPTALWDELLQLARNEVKFSVVALAVVVVAVVVLVVRKRRSVNGSVRLDGRKPIAYVKS